MSRVSTIHYLKCPVFTNYETCKETGKYGPYTGNRNYLRGSKMSDLIDSDCQVAIINMFKEVKEIMFTEVKYDKNVTSNGECQDFQSRW